MCLLNNFPGDADAAGPGTTLRRISVLETSLFIFLPGLLFSYYTSHWFLANDKVAFWGNGPKEVVAHYPKPLPA